MLRSQGSLHDHLEAALTRVPDSLEIKELACLKQSLMHIPESNLEKLHKMHSTIDNGRTALEDLNKLVLELVQPFTEVQAARSSAVLWKHNADSFLRSLQQHNKYREQAVHFRDSVFIRPQSSYYSNCRNEPLSASETSSWVFTVFSSRFSVLSELTLVFCSVLQRDLLGHEWSMVSPRSSWDSYVCANNSSGLDLERKRERVRPTSTRLPKARTPHPSSSLPLSPPFHARPSWLDRLTQLLRFSILRFLPFSPLRLPISTSRFMPCYINPSISISKRPSFTERRFERDHSSRFRKGCCFAKSETARFDNMDLYC